MISIFEKMIAVILGVILLPIVLSFGIVIKLTSKGPIIYWSRRIGKNNKIFIMPKLRTMHQNTPQIATHLISDPEKRLIMFGSFMRRFSIDELPQLYCVIKGDLSFIGPRPALYNQDDLIQLRTNFNIHKITPGLTGWAQINGRDNLSITEKVELDKFYLRNKSFKLNMIILFKTILKVINPKDIIH